MYFNKIKELFKNPPSKKVILIALFIFFIVFFALNYYNETRQLRENFDATGYFLNGSPNWFIKPKYDITQWMTRTYPDRIQPACLPYSIGNKYGTDDLNLLNYYGSTFQFWRF